LPPESPRDGKDGRNGEADPIPEDVRRYLDQYFQEVKDELRQGDYYVFSLRLSSGEFRELKVHRMFFMFSESITDYLQKHDFAAQLERGNVEIAKAGFE
jgi:hypothetical protein